MKKAVIFDLDGTLIHSLPDIAAAMNRALRAWGLPEHPEEAYKYMVGEGAVNLARRAVGPRADQLENVLGAYRADYAQNCRVRTAPYRGIPEMLEALRSREIAVCVFSNKDQPDVETVLAHYFPGFPFSAVRGRREGAPIKPDPAGALAIADGLGLSPRDFLYVGDSGTDMRCGAAAGMSTVGVLWGFRPREELDAAGAQFLIAEPAELLPLLDVDDIH
ncbi:MAG: HAD family hydrolase [Clostridiales bacterium]|nr:HAD family hydrolase [Clostridiales bacterium]